MGAKTPRREEKSGKAAEKLKSGSRRDAETQRKNQQQKEKKFRAGQIRRNDCRNNYVSSSTLFLCASARTAFAFAVFLFAPSRLRAHPLP
jgi:hypothetical protein